MTEDRLIVALDLPTLEKAREMVRLLKPVVKIFKIGLRLFTASGPKVVEMVHAEGGKVFLDLKFHDIPNTVAQACESAVALGVSMLNVHASGGAEMLTAAATAVKGRAKLIGVTVLTSQQVSTPDDVLRLALLCRESGLDGVVCSPRETSQVREKLGKGFLILTPGIRPAGYKGGDDQKRIDTPQNAIRAGSNFLVIGRPILQSADPIATVREILQEIVTI
ncbi:MAG: orotidine-5'-phosphate decarboxylase [Deltaproteobacteria bacterium]|nr:orotidine-5'-phosphate decarboxylase [Deltaproteobacteria bacterium]